MLFKTKQILKPTVEQISIMNANASGDIYTIACDSENTDNSIVYSTQNEINCIILTKDSENYAYIFSDSLEQANARFGTDYTEEGWYAVDFEQGTATKFDGVLQISELDYVIYANTYFCLLMQDYVPLDNANVVTLLTADKQCKNNIKVLPLLQKREITENGIYSADEGYCGIERVNVNVMPPLQDKQVLKSGVVTADEGYYGLGTVTVNIQSGSAIDLNDVANVEKEVIDNPEEDSPVIVRYQNELYLLIKEN